MIRVETKGSVWLIDEANARYFRMPRIEGPRENGWGDPDQGPLADLTWHPIDPDGWKIDTASGRLIIHTYGSFVSAPDAVLR